MASGVPDPPYRRHYELWPVYTVVSKLYNLANWSLLRPWRGVSSYNC